MEQGGTANVHEHDASTHMARCLLCPLVFSLSGSKIPMAAYYKGHVILHASDGCWCHHVNSFQIFRASRLGELERGDCH
jgi:hypothetical protein